MSQAYCPRVKDTSEAHSAWFLRGNPMGWAPLTHSNIPQVTLPYIVSFPSLHPMSFSHCMFWGDASLRHNPSQRRIVLNLSQLLHILLSITLLYMHTHHSYTLYTYIYLISLESTCKYKADLVCFHIY